MYRIIYGKVFLIAITLFMLCFMTAAAQSSNPVAPEDILVLQDATVYRFSAQKTQDAAQADFTQAASTTSVPGLNLADPDLVSIGADRLKQFVYTVEIIARDKQKQPRPTMLELVQTNLATGERKVLMTQEGLFQFIPSPDGRYLLVTYFEPGAEFGVGWARACVIDLASNQCVAIKDVTLAYSGSEWISPTRLLILSWERQLYTFDVETNEIILHSVPTDQWSIITSARVPGTEQILLSADPVSGDLAAPTSFVLYDLKTGQLTQLAYTALTTQPYSRGVDTLLFSSDGRYLFYAGLDKRALVEFATGELIAEFDYVFGASWLNDSRSLVLRSPNGVQVFDAVTRQTTTLAPSTINTVILN